MKKLTIRKQDIKTRVTWGFNPVTRVVKNKKSFNFNRAKAKQALKKEVY